MSNQKSATVNWSYSGNSDVSFGTGATTSEKILGCLGGLLGFLLYVYLFLMRSFPWTYWKYALAGVLGFDVAGGLVCNCLNSCKRFYLSPRQPTETSVIVRLLKRPWLFTLIHIHPIIIHYCFGTSKTLFYGLFWYIVLQLSAFIVLKTPLYLQRPTAMLFCLISLILNYYVVPTIGGFEWLIPALFIKIVYGHIVQEEPYRPMTE